MDILKVFNEAAPEHLDLALSIFEHASLIDGFRVVVPIGLKRALILEIEKLPQNNSYEITLTLSGEHILEYNKVTFNYRITDESKEYKNGFKTNLSTEHKLTDIKVNKYIP